MDAGLRDARRGTILVVALRHCEVELATSEEWWKQSINSANKSTTNCYMKMEKWR